MATNRRQNQQQQQQQQQLDPVLDTTKSSSSSSSSSSSNVVAPPQPALPSPIAQEQDVDGERLDLSYAAQEEETFMEQLASIFELPSTQTYFMVQYTRVPYYKLYRAVTLCGGFEAVKRKRLWQALGRQLGIPPACRYVSSALKATYEKTLVEYEKLFYVNKPGSTVDIRPKVPKRKAKNRDAQLMQQQQTTAQLLGLDGDGDGDDLENIDDLDDIEEEEDEDDEEEEEDIEDGHTIRSSSNSSSSRHKRINLGHGHGLGSLSAMSMAPSGHSSSSSAAMTLSRGNDLETVVTAGDIMGLVDQVHFFFSSFEIVL